ncbi:antitoxin [Salipiger pallidus]|uniref:Antitoxin n=1 Tax=Salipiger pallidus TaxID=1775170 RepID=A0A8J2ZMP8_9RHOB|nr:type II toxin-antitoxin system Phd/YefM family antitoxin [Salipiger pallidus]GGG83262.1 antitoxin [Salipiger pallidus]
MDKVVEDREELVIPRTGCEGVAMVAQEEWDEIQTMLHLLSSPKNAARLRDAVAELDADGGIEVDLDSETGVLEPRVG